MYKETNQRSIVKGISWRIVATVTTIIIVYFFFGRLDLAIAAGMIETVLKVGLYWAHERAWFKVRWGKKKIEPFNLWFTGLPLSGKSTIADKVFVELQKLQIPIERIDSKDIRELIPDIGFERLDRERHIKRIGHLVKTLQQNSISVVASFISPHENAREAMKSMTVNTVEVYVKADIETCKTRDYKGVYEKALKGEIKNFTGVDDVYEVPANPQIIIDTAKLSVDEAVDQIVKYIKKRCVK